MADITKHRFSRLARGSRVGIAALVFVLGTVACGGEARPSQEEWSVAAQPVLADILVASSSITAIRSRLPGDYVPPAALRACDEMEPLFASWREAIDPGPTEEVDPLLDLLFDGLEGTCSALRAGDIALAQTEWAQTQTTIGELFSLTG
ncbi:MAG: hypothetical protein WD184_01910 [Acidimicrobiia bacterium]